MKKCSISTDNKSLEVNVDSTEELVKALYFKGTNIKAKADPEIFMRAGQRLAFLQRMVNSCEGVIDALNKRIELLEDVLEKETGDISK